MKKTLTTVVTLLAAAMLLLGVTSPASAAWAPKGAAAYSPTTHIKIDKDTGKPSQWSTAVSAKIVKDRLKSPAVRKKIDKLEGAIKLDAARWDMPLSMSRDQRVCETFSYYSKSWDDCFSALETRYWKYLDGSKKHKSCKYEDSNHCVYVAADRGNRKGKSFYATHGGTIIHLTHKEARTLIK